MKYIEIDEQLLIPADKIVNLVINQEHEERIEIWLVGGQIQTITYATATGAKETYNKIKELLKTL